jgi:hypothetical protein
LHFPIPQLQVHDQGVCYAFLSTLPPGNKIKERSHETSILEYLTSRSGSQNKKHFLISKNALQSKCPILAKLDDLPYHYFAIPLTKTRTRQFLSPVNAQHVRPKKKKKNGPTGKKMQLPEQNNAKEWKRKTQVMVRCTIY